MSSVLQKHRKYLAQFAGSLNEKFSKDEKLEDLLKGKPFGQVVIDKQYKEERTKDEGQISYIKAIRTYLVENLGLYYRDAIYVIAQIFGPVFAEKGYTYLKAIQTLLDEEKEDPANAHAEWRAFFENRFQRPILDFFSDLLAPTLDKKYQVTINFSIWTFLGNRTLPIYLTHINIKENTPAYNARQKVFEELANVQPGYSFVWENVRNNVTTIFYFDHNPSEENVMHIYEIDPDVKREQGRGLKEYFGKWAINRKHRKQALMKKLKPNPDATVFEKERRKSPEEKAYQYGVMRFLIRSGIFNPFAAAYMVRPGEPAFEDILAGSGEKLRGICTEQYDSSRRQKRHCFLEEDKYDDTENEALNSVIEYIDKHNPDYINARMAIFEEGLFWLTQDKENTIYHVYWLPIVTNWRDRQSGGTIFINTDTRIAIPDDEPITQNSIVPQKIITLLYYLTGLVDDKQIEEIEESIRPSVETSAAVSIMSRNISHNIASHVLSYLKNILGDELLMLQHQVFENLIQGQENGRWFFNEDILLNGYELNNYKLVAPYLRSLGKLLGYFQERQDYIGVMASGWYLYFGTVHFKEAVLDYFCGEQIAHSADGTRTGKSRNLILDYIAYSEKYEQKDIVIEAQKQMPGGATVDINDLEIALPAGTTGRQGIFTILENFIRNTAKHGISKEDRKDKIKISLTIGEAKRNSRNYYRIDLADNSGRVEDKVVEDIRKVLEADLVKPDGSVDEQHKGIKEMQIAAGWLRGIPPFGLADEKRQEGLPVLEVSRSGKNLQYTFYLRKPKSVLFIVPQKGDFFDGAKLRKKYEHLSHWDIEGYGDNINPSKLPYRFVAIHEAVTLSKKQKGRIKDRVPVRLVEGITNQDLKDHDKEALENEIYRRWLNQNFKLDWRKRKIRPAEIPIGIFDPRRELLEKEKQYVFTGEQAYEQPILFRTHNDSKKDFEEFKHLKNGKYLKNKLFLEGISGANSTNRLLREEKITPAWRLKIRETALTKVLVIDERIWKNMRQREEDRQFNHDKMALKNIHIFSLELEGKAMNFVNLNNEKVATLADTGEINWLQNKESFHFVSLHQGLLDRMLSYCSGFLQEEGYAGEKDKATHLFDKFKNAFVARNRYLIHSGRSKTPVLPKGTAFVQLSSLDTALSDCKFTLNELLYSSIVEEEVK
ncbi:MAG: hypothetical protein H6558_18350 [Lewinellaceae bacterium]|nr:hypothetical protein [Lewinellaceae bacterium]